MTNAYVYICENMEKTWGELLNNDLEPGLKDFGISAS
jgi:hypothetical protein